MENMTFDHALLLYYVLAVNVVAVSYTHLTLPTKA